MELDGMPCEWLQCEDQASWRAKAQREGRTVVAWLCSQHLVDASLKFENLDVTSVR